MKPDVFFSALGNIREDLAADALKTEHVQSATAEQKSRTKAAKQPVRTILVIAASLFLVVMIGAVLYLRWTGSAAQDGNALSEPSVADQPASEQEPAEDLTPAPTVELTSKYGLTLRVSEELADHFVVDVEDYVFPCAWEDGWPDITGGQEIIEHAAFVFSDPDNATGENGREGLIWCISAIPVEESSLVMDPNSEEDTRSMIFYINERLLGRNEEYVYTLVFPCNNWQYNPESLESLDSYWRHLYHGYEVLQEVVERNGLTGDMDWLDTYYEQIVCFVDQERTKMTNQQTNSGVSDRDNDGLELVENADNGVIELGGVRYKFYMSASPLFTPEYYEITVPSDFRVGEVIGYETDNTYDWYYAEVEPLSGWLIRYMRRNGDDKYSEGELYKAESITDIPQWIEDARKAIMENTGGYPGLEEGHTIIPNSDPPFQGSFGLTWDHVEEQPISEIPVPNGGYTETWTEEQIYEYIPENLPCWMNTSERAANGPPMETTPSSFTRTAPSAPGSAFPMLCQTPENTLLLNCWLWSTRIGWTRKNRLGIPSGNPTMRSPAYRYGWDGRRQKPAPERTPLSAQTTP